jgi:hypothetical protein
MSTCPRAWRNALIVCWAAGLTALIVGSLAQPAHAQPTVVTSATTAVAPATSPALAPSTAAPPATVVPGGSPALSTPSANSPASSAPVTPGSQSLGVGPVLGGCGLFDIACTTRAAISVFFRDLVTSALNPVFRFLARSILASPRVDQMPRVQSLWTTSVWIANTSFVLLVVLAGLLVMSHQSLQTSYAAKDIAPRLVVATVASNANLLVIGPVIDVANALSAALMGKGVDPDQAANTLKGLVLSALTDSGDVFLPLLALVAVIAALAVLFTFTIRLMLLVLLTVAAPLALACHALPQTEGIARLWWRTIAGVLAIQVAQSLVLATALRVFFTSDQAALFGFRSGQSMFDLVLVICLLYILARIPSWVAHLILQGGMGRSPIVRIARTLAAVLIFRGLSGKLASSRARKPPPGPGHLPTVPPPVPPPGPTPPVHPEPPPGPPPVRGEQLELPLEASGRPGPQPQTPAARRASQRLPGTAARPPRWVQTSLPIRPRYTQTQLPAPPARRHVQPELPLAFPRPGTPGAGRSPRRLADIAALRDAEARARRRTNPNPPDRSQLDRRSR